MHFEDTYRVVFMVYRVLGMVPYRFSPSNTVVRPKKLEIIFLIAEYLWIIFLTIFEFYVIIDSIIVCYNYVTHIKLNLYIGLDLLILTTFRVLLVIITFEAFLKRNFQVKILRNLFEIDSIFIRDLNVDIDYGELKQLIRNTFIKWGLIYIITEMFLISLTLYEGANNLPTFLMLFVYPLLKLTLNGSKYITFALLIKYRIEAMHKILINSSLWMEKSSWKKCDNLQKFTDNQAIELKRMINLWRIFNKIYKTVELTNYSFKWSISVNFSVEILSVCAVLFHILDYILGPPNRFSVLSLISFGMFFFYYVIRVGMLIRIAHCTIEEADMLANKVHRLCANGTVSDDLQNFVSKFAGRYHH